MKTSIICVDFDGSLVTHEYPEIGFELPLAIETLKELQKNSKLILYTMRSGPELQRAVDWCKERDIKLWGINNNPEQSEWTKSPKVYGQLYIDDAALGAPLKWYKESSRPGLDWGKIKIWLKENNYI